MMQSQARTYRLAFTFVCGLIFAGVACAQSLVITPALLSFTGVADSTKPPPPQTVQVTSTGGNLPFVLLEGQAKYVTVSPIGGITPATITISPGTNTFGTFQDEPVFAVTTSSAPYPGSVGLKVTISYTLPPPPKINAVVNAASLQPGSVSPGEIISIFGDNLV